MSRPASEIQLLSSEVVDQIAAGEVVERPAHMVKELVENAIDAGATSIEVEYDQGGRRVRVTDDGQGIKPDQLRLALARHATSKIAQAADLWNLHSFGFRGEALASIAAVSRLTLKSRVHDSAQASQVVSEFGRISLAEPSGGNLGTTILVEELFENIPARLKFMKSESAESTQIRAVLRAIAVVHPQIEFRIKTKGKLENVWPKAETHLERAQQILENQKLYEFQSDNSTAGIRCRVVFAGPHDVAGNARQILTFVQGRWVQDRSLQAAVNEAYRGLLMHGEYPIAIVMLEVPSEDVDVNIHPTKSQVKFRDPQAAFRAVHRSLREALEKAPWLDRASRVDTENESLPVVRMTVADFTRPYDAKSAVPQAPVSMSINERFTLGELDHVQFKSKFDVAQAVHQSELSNQSSQSTSESVTTANAVETRAATGAWSRLQVLGQANLTYIVAQDHDRLMLIDQHAAHERVAYERLMRAWLGGSADAQSLLLPLTFELEGDQAETLMGVASELEKLGIVIDQAGPQTIAVRATPLLIQASVLVKALKRLASEISERGGSFAVERKISDLCATMACHSVVRAGQALSHEQMKSLLSQMDEFPLSSFCPHGRPVSVDFSFTQLERDFGRIV